MALNELKAQLDSLVDQVRHHKQHLDAETVRRMSKREYILRHGMAILGSHCQSGALAAVRAALSHRGLPKVIVSSTEEAKTLTDELGMPEKGRVLLPDDYLPALQKTAETRVRGERFVICVNLSLDHFDEIFSPEVLENHVDPEGGAIVVWLNPHAHMHVTGDDS